MIQPETCHLQHRVRNQERRYNMNGEADSENIYAGSLVKNKLERKNEKCICVSAGHLERKQTFPK